ncbi:hypothetical protein J8341_23045, partial [Escherichia coli]|nr:hypothetical protein [Escherichia coli]
MPFLPVCCRDRDERILAVRTNRCYGKYDFFLQGLPRKLSDLILRKTVPTVYMTHCPVDFISPDFV